MLAKRRLVLLISHDPHGRAVLRRALEAEGFLVGESANSREGERTIRRVKPDVAIADFQLESVEGEEASIEKLRRADESTLLYLVTTGSNALTGEFNLRELGVAGVFLKPIDPVIVVQALREILA